MSCRTSRRDLVRTRWGAHSRATWRSAPPLARFCHRAPPAACLQRRRQTVSAGQHQARQIPRLLPLPEFTCHQVLGNTRFSFIRAQTCDAVVLAACSRVHHREVLTADSVEYFAHRALHFTRPTLPRRRRSRSTSTGRSTGCDGCETNLRSLIQ